MECESYYAEAGEPGPNGNYGAEFKVEVEIQWDESAGIVFMNPMVYR